MNRSTNIRDSRYSSAGSNISPVSREVDALNGLPDDVRAQINGLSSWQEFLDRLGLTNYRGQILANAAVRDEERNYNSPAEQVKRQEAAGLNSDLLGLMGAESDTAGSTMESNRAAHEQALTGFSNAVQGLFTGLVGLANGYVEFTNAITSGDKNMLTASLLGDEIGSNMVDRLAGDFLSGGDPSLKSIQTSDELRSLSDKFIDPLLKEGDYDFFKGVVRSPRLRKMLNSRLKNYLNSASGKADYYDAVNRAYSSVYGARLQQKINDAADGVIEGRDGEDAVTDVFTNLGSIIMRSRYYEALNAADYAQVYDPTLNASAENASNQYSSDFYGNLNGHSAAENQNQSNEWNTTVNELKNDIMSYCKELQNSDNKTLRKIGSILPVVAMYFLGALPRPTIPFPDIKPGAKVNNTTNNYDYSTKNEHSDKKNIIIH